MALFGLPADLCLHVTSHGQMGRLSQETKDIFDSLEGSYFYSRSYFFFSFPITSSVPFIIIIVFTFIVISTIIRICHNIIFCLVITVCVVKSRTVCHFTPHAFKKTLYTDNYYTEEESYVLLVTTEMIKNGVSSLAQ